MCGVKFNGRAFSYDCDECAVRGYEAKYAGRTFFTSCDGRTVFAIYDGPVEDGDALKRDKWAALAHWAKYAGRKAKKKHADRVTIADCTGRTASAAWIG